MLVRRNGIYKNIKPNDYGIYLKKGFIKVENEEIVKEKEKIDEELPQLKEIQAEIIDEEPVENCELCDLEPEKCEGCADIEVPIDAEEIEIIDEEPKTHNKTTRKKKQQ